MGLLAWWRGWRVSSDHSNEQVSAPQRCPQHLITVLIAAAAWPGQVSWDNSHNILGQYPIFPSQAPAPRLQQLACKISANTRRHHQLLLLLLQMRARHSAGDIYSLQSHVKMARAKSRPYTFAQHLTLIENKQPTKLLNIGITLDILPSLLDGKKKLYPF